MKILILINDGSYGSEKAYNALRLAMTLQKNNPEIKIRIFLLADAVTCAIQGQLTPQGYYNIERMLHAILSKGGEVKICTSCSEARGITSLNMINGVEISTMNELSQWIIESDKVLTF